MSKISELKKMMNEIGRDRPLSMTLQNMIKSADAHGLKSGSRTVNKIKQIVDDLKQVKKEASGLDHKTDKKLDQAIMDLAGIYLAVKQHGIKALESHED